jgi:cyclophilin family peptidyl-prolyl cis-trans isomerase
MSWRFRAVLSFAILAVIAACGQQVAQPATKPIAPSTEVRPLVKVAPAKRADYWKSAPQMTVDSNKNYVATITTSKGDIVVSLDAKSAPQTVNNFVFLANQGFYDGLTFHRVEPGFVIQGGDPQGNGRGGPGYTVPGEFKLKHVEGAIAMARLSDQVNPKRDSSGSQFYITLAATPFLDETYTVFGQVTKGIDVVKKIAMGDVIQKIVISNQ